MLFARLGDKQKMGIGIAIFVFVLLLAFFAGYYLIGNKKTDKSQETGSQSNAEVKILRSQEEITASYKEYMNRLIERLQKAESREDVVGISQNMFFDVYVPTDLKDMHVQKMLETNKLIEDITLDAEQLKEKLIYIINELLAENQKIIENL